MKKAQWIKIEDQDVKVTWQCAECGRKAIIVPNWYQNNGTPVCPRCDDDMEYIKTEIKNPIIVQK